MLRLERKQEFLKGSIAGCVGATVKYIYNELMQLLNIAKYDNNATALGVVLKSWEHTPLYWLLGFITALIIGAFFGVLIAFIYTYVLSHRQKYFKAIGIGIGIWLFNVGFMSRFFFYPEDIMISVGDVFYSLLISLIIYGVVTVFTLDKLNFFEQTPRNSKTLKRRLK